MSDLILVPRMLLDDLRDSLAAEIDERVLKFGEEYRPHILLGMRAKLTHVDVLLSTPSGNQKPIQSEDGLPPVNNFLPMPKVNPPATCRQRLAAEGKPYPRSSCQSCGQLSPNWRECDALINCARP